MKRTAIASLLVLTLAAGSVRAGKPAAAVVEGNNRFAVELYRKLATRKGNLFFSPFSLSSALAMTSAGARGKTLDQMSRTLHLPPQKVLHPALGGLLDEVNGLGAGKPGYALHVANALWGQKGTRLRPDFLTVARSHYGAGLREVDFSRDPEAARKAINAWVEYHTDHKVKVLLAPGAVKSDTRLVLANAVYFKADWAHRFERSATRTVTFHAPDRPVNVPLMNQKGTFRYLDGDTF